MSTFSIAVLNIVLNNSEILVMCIVPITLLACEHFSNTVCSWSFFGVAHDWLDDCMREFAEVGPRFQRHRVRADLPETSLLALGLDNLT